MVFNIFIRNLTFFYFWICRMKKEVLIAPGVWELSLLFLSFRPLSNFYLTSAWPAKHLGVYNDKLYSFNAPKADPQVNIFLLKLQLIAFLVIGWSKVQTFQILNSPSSPVFNITSKSYLMLFDDLMDTFEKYGTLWLN